MSANLPFQADYAKSSRSKCRTTKQLIPAGTLRLAILIPSRHYDGMQPNWNDAAAFFAKKNRRKRPQSVDEIAGYDDLRPDDQAKIETWIQEYGGGATNSSKKKKAKKAQDNETTNQQQEDEQEQQHKQAVRAQGALVWQVCDLITKSLSTSAIKSILSQHHVPLLGVGAAGLAKLLAELIVFGVPPLRGNANFHQAQQPQQEENEEEEEDDELCLGHPPKALHFCPRAGQYVCQAGCAWGECTYQQAVDDTVCQAFTLDESTTTTTTSSKATLAWWQAVQAVCNPSTPLKRLYIPKSTVVPKVTPAMAKKRKSKAAAAYQPPTKMGKFKPSLSRARMDPECGLPQGQWHVLDESSASATGERDFSETFPTDLWDTSLCLLDMASGTNSQYKLQILVHDRHEYIVKAPRDSAGVLPPWDLATKKAADASRKNENSHGYGCFLWRVWGRVGGNGGGGTKLERFGCVDEAKREFCKLFKKQTGNEWYERKRFVKHPKKFMQLDIHYNDIEQDDQKMTNGIVQAGDPKSKLDPRVQEVIAKMFDPKLAQTQLEDLNFDVAKMPLGKITEEQLKDAFTVLTEIESVLTKQQQGDATSTSTSIAAAATKHGKLEQLSNQFYSKCPSTNPTLIDSMELLKSKVHLVDELINLHVSEEVKNAAAISASAEVKAPVDEAYEKLKTEFVPLDPAGPHFSMLQQYVQNTKKSSVLGMRNLGMASGWDTRGLRLLDAFEIHRQGEKERYEPSKLLGNRRLLWHGSRISNYTGILSQGLRIAPPQAPSSGYRFGKGIYFADMLEKSTMYTFQINGPCEMMVLLCDVSLGETYETSEGSMYMDEPQPGTNSTHALSEVVPDPSMSLQLKDGDDAIPMPAVGIAALDKTVTDTVLVPLGTPMVTNHDDDDDEDSLPGCDVSEFVVYDQAQVQIRYLLRLARNAPSQADVDAAQHAFALAHQAQTSHAVSSSSVVPTAIANQGSATNPAVHLSSSTGATVSHSTNHTVAPTGNSASSTSTSSNNQGSAANPVNLL